MFLLFIAPPAEHAEGTLVLTTKADSRLRFRRSPSPQLGSGRKHRFRILPEAHNSTPCASYKLCSNREGRQCHVDDAGSSERDRAPWKHRPSKPSRRRCCCFESPQAPVATCVAAAERAASWCSPGLSVADSKRVQRLPPRRRAPPPREALPSRRLGPASARLRLVVGRPEGVFRPERRQGSLRGLSDRVGV